MSGGYDSRFLFFRANSHSGNIREFLLGYRALSCMGAVFILLTLPCSNYPKITPTDKIRNINNALDIDNVQNKNVRVEKMLKSLLPGRINKW
jgi:hypothetical protein